LDSGVSKLIGTAKQESSLKCPVIGVVPWGLVEGRQALWEREADGQLLTHRHKMVIENFGEHEKSFASMKPHGQKSVRLSRQHSHFILVDDGTMGVLRGEANFRAKLETKIHSGSAEVQEAIRQHLIQQKLGWQGVNMNMARTDEQLESSVTTVCVVIEGGAGTINKAFEAVCGGTAVLLCKGTGKTADLLCDAFQYVEKGYFDGRAADDDRSSATSHASTRASAVEDDPIERMSSHLSERSSKGGKDLLIERVFANDPNDEWLQADIQKRYDAKFPMFNELQEQIVAIACSGLCQVYTVASLNDGHSDLSGALLVCALKKQRMFGHAWSDCLPLVIAWNHEGILRQVINCLKVSEPETKRALENAFHCAFAENKVGMAEILLDFWDCTAVYNFKKQAANSRQIFQSMRITHKAAKMQAPVTRHWAQLVAKVLNSEISGAKQALQHWSQLQAMAENEDETKKLFDMQDKKPSWTTMFSIKSIRDAISAFDSQGETNDDRGPNLMDKIRRFEATYREVTCWFRACIYTTGNERVSPLICYPLQVLGEDWWYEMSTLGSLMDLFLSAPTLPRPDLHRPVPLISWRSAVHGPCKSVDQR